MVQAKRYMLDAEKCALVVIDIQDKISAAIPPEILKDVMRNTNILIAAAREFGIPVLVVQQYSRSLGPTREEVQQVLGPYEPIEKMTFDCCAEPSFKKALEGTGASQVILTGIEAHICILQTSLALLEGGYGVFIPADAVASRAKHNWNRALEAIRDAGGCIGSTEMYLFQLLGVAGTERFRKLSPLVR